MKNGDYMANRRPQQNLAKNPPEKNASVTVSLRLPDTIKEAAQAYGDMIGVSLNGLLCTALVDYLAARGCKITPRR